MTNINTPQTGDETNLMWPIIAIVASLAVLVALAIILIYKKKNGPNDKTK